MRLRRFLQKPTHLSFIPAPDFSGGQAALSFIKGNVETAYYNAIAFVILFIIAKILLRIIGAALNIIAGIPVIKQINKLLGGCLGFWKSIYLRLSCYTSHPYCR